MNSVTLDSANLESSESHPKEKSIENVGVSLKKRIKKEEDVESTFENQCIVNLSANSRSAKIDSATRAATMRSRTVLQDVRDFDMRVNSTVVK